MRAGSLLTTILGFMVQSWRDEVGAGNIANPIKQDKSAEQVIKLHMCVEKFAHCVVQFDLILIKRPAVR
jgi:hypothetical protein